VPIADPIKGDCATAGPQIVVDLVSPVMVAEDRRFMLVSHRTLRRCACTASVLGLTALLTGCGERDAAATASSSPAPPTVTAVAVPLSLIHISSASQLPSPPLTRMSEHACPQASDSSASGRRLPPPVWKPIPSPCCWPRMAPPPATAPSLPPTSARVHWLPAGPERTPRRRSPRYPRRCSRAGSHAKAMACASMHRCCLLYTSRCV